MTNIFVDALGYLAAGIIGISMFMKDMFKLRCINTIGCILFVAYAYVIKAYPVALINIIIILENIYNIFLLIIEKDNA